jgi:putative heme-binding domain-containing protein
MSTRHSFLWCFTFTLSIFLYRNVVSAQPPEADPAAAAANQQKVIPELDGGNWGRGRRIFYSSEVGCFRCHASGEQGKSIGPDLSHLINRDYASVLRHVKNPDHAIAPEFEQYEIELDDGTRATGVVRTIDGRWMLGDAKGSLRSLPKDRIRKKQPIKQSLMPRGLVDGLTQEALRDLMTYLLTTAPRMPIAGKVAAPPMRSRQEVQSVLAGSIPLPDKMRPIRVVLVAGKKDHGPGEHDYPAWQVQWGSLLAAAEAATIDTAWNFPSEEQLQTADVLIFFQKGDWNDERAKKMDAYFRRGGGAIYLHWAVNGGDLAPQFAERIGMASKAGAIRYRHGPLQLELSNTDHPILRNLEKLDLLDESYWTLAGDPAQITLLASSPEEGKLWPQIWCYERDKGRVFVAIPGHYNWTFDDPLFRIVLLRGIAWSCREPIDRFNDLVLPGARVK